MAEEYTLETQKDGDMWALIYQGTLADCVKNAATCIEQGYAVRVIKVH